MSKYTQDVKNKNDRSSVYTVTDEDYRLFKRALCEAICRRFATVLKEEEQKKTALLRDMDAGG